jgi:hypothetical protein
MTVARILPFWVVAELVVVVVADHSAGSSSALRWVGQFDVNLSEQVATMKGNCV